jgi:hypothetical protein
MTYRGGRMASEGDAKGKAATAEVALLMAAFFVGTDFVSVKYALEGIPPLVFVGRLQRALPTRVAAFRPRSGATLPLSSAWS